MRIETIKKGQGGFLHRVIGHYWNRLSPERSREIFSTLGVSAFEPISTDTAIYRSIYRCDCGALMLTEEIGLI